MKKFSVIKKKNNECLRITFLQYDNNHENPQNCCSLKYYTTFNFNTSELKVFLFKTFHKIIL